MRVRIKYSKQGLMKFIGHLDMMRSFQKLLRQSDIDVTFSEGYSPHMIMSYAFPLGVGMTSDSEYVDVDLNQTYPSVDLVRRLNEASPDGIHFLDAREVPLGKGNKGMTLVARADYTINFRQGYEWPDGWKEMFSKFISRPEILAVKKGKKTTQQINISPLIYKAETDPEPFVVTGIGEVPEGEGRPGWDNVRQGDIFLSLSAGSAANIRPELVMETFAESCGFDFGPYTLKVNRDEVFADVGDSGNHKFVTLIGLGSTIG